MLVVIAIMGAVLAMAAPHFLPTLLYSTHEGAARHLANFGRAAIAEATLTRERIYVRIDLDHQEYWCEVIPDPPEEAPLHAALANDDGLPEDDQELGQLAQEELDKRAENAGTDEGDKVLDEQSRRMTEQSNLLARKALVAQAARVKHDERVLPHSARELLHPSLATSAQQEETEPQEVRNPLISRTRLPEEIHFARVEIGGVEHKKGVATVELSPAGLDVEAKFSLVNQRGNAFTVTWDPVSGTTDVTEEETS